MKASLLIVLLTLTSVSVSLAQIGGPDPYSEFPPIESNPETSVPEGPPIGNLSPFVGVEVLQQENGCSLFVGEASDPEGKSLTLEWRAVDLYTEQEIVLGTDLSLMACLPSGTYRILFKATDPEGKFSVWDGSIVVETRRSAPDLKMKSVTPSFLWPPNGKLWPVQLAYEVTHDPQSKPHVRIVSVNCNQRLSQNDVIQAGPLELYLAARRTSRLGERIYEVTIEAVDENGLKDSETITIRVPADSDPTDSTKTGRTAALTKPSRR